MFASTTLVPGMGLFLAAYPRSCRLGWCLCRRLLFAPCSRWLLLSWWSSLRLRVFGGYWISPLSFHDRRFDSRATCSTLPPVSRLSFVLGEFSFWLGFGLCLAILLAPWGCRRAYCGPHCGRKSARVLASLLGPSPSGVRHLSRVCSSVGGPVGSSVGGPVGVAHSFHPSLLLGGVLVRLCGGPCWRSLAMSWACPPLFLCVGLVGQSRRIVAPLAQCLFWRFPSLVGVSSCGGASPHVLGSVGALGFLRWLHLYRLTPDLVSLPSCSSLLELSSVFHTFPTRRSASIHGDNFVSISDLCVSLANHSHRVVFIGHLKSRVTGLT